AMLPHDLRTFGPAKWFSASRENVHPRDHVSLENAVDDIHALDDLGEHCIASVEAPVFSKVEEPLSVPGIMAPGAHPHGAPVVMDRPELVPDEARVAHVLVGPQSPALDHEIRLHPLPNQPVVVAGARQVEDSTSHDWGDIAPKMDDERSTAARVRHG